MLAACSVLPAPLPHDTADFAQTLISEMAGQARPGDMRSGLRLLNDGPYWNSEMAFPVRFRLWLPSPIIPTNEL